MNETGARRTRVCVVLDSHWDALMGGAEYQVKCLIELLAARDDVEVFLVCRFCPSSTEAAGYRIVRFGRARKHGRLRMLMDLPSLYRTLTTLRPDVVYQRCLLPFTGACAAYCRRHGAKLVFHIAHDRDVTPAGRFPRGPYGLLQAAARRIGELGMRRADAIVAQTKRQAAQLRAAYGLEAALVVGNFHPLPDGETPAPPRERKRVVWIANFKSFKRPERFVDLAEALRDRSDVELVMIGRPGPPSQYGPLHERIARLPNLRYLGELPFDRVNDEIAASDLLVNTSDAEGFPNTFIQAWLRGVPVVSCFVDPDGCLSTAGTGVLVGAVERLPDVVRVLLDDPQSRAELGRKARAYARAHHTVASAEPLLDLLTTISKDPAGFFYTSRDCRLSKAAN